MTLKKPLVVTAGEPAGIGPELCNRLVDSAFRDQVVIVGDRRRIDARLAIVDTPFPAEVEPGQPSSANAATLLDGLRLAARGCLDGEYSAALSLSPVIPSSWPSSPVPTSRS